MKKYFEKRCLKNTIAIVLIVLMCGSIFFTMKYAGEHTESSPGVEMSQNNSGGQPPQQDNSGSSSDAQPPEKPEGEIGGADNQQASGNENSSQQSNPEQGNAPAENGSQDENAQNSDQQSSPEQGNAPDMSGAMPSTGISYIYYIVFSIEGLILAVSVMYLIMSGFGKKNIRQTFCNRDKIVIYILASIIITSGIAVAGVKTTEAFVLSGSGGQQNGGGQSAESVSYSAVKEISEDTTLKSASFESETSNENVILATGDITAELSDITVTKSGDSDGGDSSNFYGNNSGIIAKDGAALSLKNINVSTDASGANGVFSYGGSATTNNSSSDGTSVTISDSKITTTGDNAGGIMTTGGGIMKAANLTINTAGTSSAAIRTDRGGGTVTVEGGTYTTTGAGSPSIYSTADIKVSDAKLLAKASEGIVIEGKNTVTIENCELTDSNTKLNGQSTTYKNIFLYQSMSGDAAEGNAEFTASNSDITTEKGDTLYVTNTSAVIALKNNTIVNNDSDGNFLRAQADSWGSEGSNGGDVTLTMTNQKASGDIVIDSVSTLDMTMKTGSYYEGTINGDNSAKSIKLTLDKKSKIKLTGDSYITSLDDADSDYSNIDFNGYTLYVNGEAIN